MDPAGRRRADDASVRVARWHSGAMPRTSDELDPWDPSRLPFTRLWPVYAGVGAGLVLALVWLGLGRPSVSFTPFLVIGGTLVGGVAAALAPTGERSARFLDVAFPALVAGVSTRFFGAIGTLLTGNGEDDTVDTLLVYLLVMAFFVGFPLLVAKVFQNPARRLPDRVLAQIGEPYPTRREPRLVTVRAEDGTTHRISVLRGGFVAGLRIPFDVAGVTGFAAEGQVASGPRRNGSAASRSTKAPRAATGGSRRRSGATDDGTDTDGSGTGTGRAAPAPTSRTTPKGTTGGRKKPKR
jgi:hypothetical protein